MQRSLKLLREEGYHCEITEHWNPFSRRRSDLLGFVDILALRDGETLAVQTTSASNVAARITKITEHENLPLARKANWRIEVHGWRKRGKEWIVRREDIS